MRKNTIILTLLLTASILALLAGCGATDSTGPSSGSEPDEAGFDCGDCTLDEARYLDEVYADTMLIEEVGEVDVLEWGQLTCDVLDEGDTATDIASMLSEESASMPHNRVKDLANAVGHAIREICPEYAYQLDSFG